MFCVFMSCFSATEETDNILGDYFGNYTMRNHESAVVKLCLLLLLLPVVTFAVLGNLLIVTSVTSYHRLRTQTNIFVVSLATADLLVALLVMPFSLLRTVDRWMFGKWVCTMHSLLDVTFSTASIFSLSCIALDRYLAVCDPLRYPARMSRRKIACLLLLSWFAPIGVSVPIVTLGQGVDEQARGYVPAKCVFLMNAPFAVFAFTVSFLLPTVFMTTAYWRIFLAARKQVRRINTVENQGNRTQGTFQFQPGSSACRERKAAKTLGIIMGVYLLCWLPFFIVTLVRPLLGHSISSWATELVLWLGYANSALNPILYAFFNATFRHAFASILGCRRCVLGHQDGWLTPPNRSTHTATEMAAVSG